MTIDALSTIVALLGAIVAALARILWRLAERVARLEGRAGIGSTSPEEGDR